MPFRFELIRGWEPFGRYARGRKFLRLFIPGFKPSPSIFLDELARLVAGDIRWLDIGCGTNWLIDHYREGTQGLAVGIDIIVPMNLGNKTRFIRSDVMTLPFADQSFDLVTATSVVEHLKNPEGFLKEMKRILKPAGILFIRTPNILSPIVSFSRPLPIWLKRRLIRKLYHQELDLFPTYYRFNTPHRAAALAKKFGFRLKKLILAEDPFLGTVPLFFISLLGVIMLSLPFLQKFRAQLLAVFERSGLR